MRTLVLLFSLLLALPVSAKQFHGNGANCDPGEAPRGVDGLGAVEDCFVPAGSGHTNGADCDSGEYARGVDENGVAEWCTDATTEINAEMVSHLVDKVLGHTNDLRTSATGAVDGRVFVTTGIGTGEYIDIVSCNGNEKLEYTAGSPDTLTCEAITGYFTPTDIDTDYGDETVTSTWTFQDFDSGTFGEYDLNIGSTYGALKIGNTGIYSSSFSSGTVDLDKAVLIRQEGNLGVTNDPGIEFSFIEQGNTSRFWLMESAADNATTNFRSMQIAGPYSAANGNAQGTCSHWTTYDSNIDCDTGTTGPDLLVGDDVEVLGTVFAHETLNFEGATADGNHVILQVGADPGADVTITLPTTTGTLSTGAHEPALDDIQGTTLAPAPLAGTLLCFAGGGGHDTETCSLSGGDITATYGSPNMALTIDNFATFSFPTITSMNAASTMTAAPPVNDNDTSIATSSFVQAETVASGDVSGTLGTGFTLDAGVVDATAAAASLKTEVACAYVEDPVSSESFVSSWRAPVAVTVTEIWCETDAGTVGLDLQIDDGTPLDINGSDISCATADGTSDTSFGNSAALAQDDRLDIVLGTVSTAVRLSVCWRYTVD